MSNFRDTNIALLELFGLNQPGLNVLGLQLEATPSGPPVLTVERHIDAHNTPGLNSATQRFQLTAISPAPEAAAFDVDTACADAMRRVSAHINAIYETHSAAIRSGFKEARRRMHCRGSIGRLK